MSSIAELVRPRRGEMPAAGWWVLLGGAIALHLALPLGWIIAIGVMVFVLVQRTWPLDFITAYFLVAAGASYINYGGGHLTYQLSLLTGLILFMLFCYVLERRSRWATVVHSPLTVPLLLYVGLSIVNYARGLLVGNSVRYAGLELIAALGIGSTLLMGSSRFTEARAKAALIWLYIVCLGHAALGIYIYAVLHVRGGTVYFTPVPGVCFALMFAFALRARTTRGSLAGLLLLTPLLLHQFISFTRGFWFAIIGSTLFTIAMFIGRGPGVGARWRRTLIGLLFMALLGAVAAGVAAAALGLGNIGATAADRFASSTGTEMSWETGSNVVRLAEYFHVLGLIEKAPVFGYGLGYWYVKREPIGFRLVEQWWVHQNYMLVVLKMGLVGLVPFVWMLIGALRTGLRGRLQTESWRQAWCLGAAAATVYVVIYCTVHFPFAEVNTVFVLALMWGGAMAITSERRTVLRWRVEDTGSGEGAPGRIDPEGTPC